MECMVPEQTFVSKVNSTFNLIKMVNETIQHSQLWNLNPPESCLRVPRNRHHENDKRKINQKTQLGSFFAKYVLEF